MTLTSSLVHSMRYVYDMSEGVCASVFYTVMRSITLELEPWSSCTMALYSMMAQIDRLIVYLDESAAPSCLHDLALLRRLACMIEVS